MSFLKIVRSFLVSAVISFAGMCCYMDPGDRLGVVNLEAVQSIVGVNYYNSRIDINDAGLIRLKWKGDSSSKFEEGYKFTSLQTTFANGFSVGLPITLWFSIYSSDFRDFLSSDAIDETDAFDIRNAELYYKIVSDFSQSSQQSSSWHICQSKSFPEGMKTVFNHDGISWDDRGVMLFGRNVLDEKQIAFDGESVSVGDKIIFMFVYYNAYGVCNIDEEYVPKNGKRVPILTSECLQTEGKGYVNSHIFWVEYNGSNVYWR